MVHCLTDETLVNPQFTSLFYCREIVWVLAVAELLSELHVSRSVGAPLIFKVSHSEKNDYAVCDAGTRFHSWCR